MRLSVVHGGEHVPTEKVRGNKGIRREYLNVKRQEAIRRQYRNVDRGYSVVDLRSSTPDMISEPAPLDQFWALLEYTFMECVFPEMLRIKSKG